MKHIIQITFSPLLALFIFTLGNGLFSTFITLRLNALNSGALIIGLMTALFYLGFVGGSFNIKRFILRVGHIRSFAAFASIITVIVLLQGLVANTILWLIARFIYGFATAGIFVVIESWLLAIGESSIRGRVLALYMISYYAAQALGQFLLNLAPVTSFELFSIIALLSSLSVIPLSLSKIPSPEITTPSSLSLKSLFKFSAPGLIGSLCSGLILSVLYSFLPLVVFLRTGFNSQVATYMAVLIFGGMALQYPAGRLSDFFDRRIVLLILTLLSCVILVLLWMVNNPRFDYIGYFLLGGFTFAIYPVSISLACDKLPEKDLVSGSQGILLAYSIGACLGPLITPLFIKLININGFFIYLILVLALLSFYLAWRSMTVKIEPYEDNFTVLPQTSPIVVELDPRTPKDG